MEHLQYRHFSSHTQEGAEAVVMPTGDRDQPSEADSCICLRS
jgi:phage gp45-like